MSASLKHLEALHWVAQLGSFQAAAARLHTTQSAVSKRIAELESSFGRPLFDRSRRSAVLTPEGRRLAVGAGELLVQHERLMQATPGERGGPESFQSVFKLGATELIGMTWLPRFVSRVNELHPQLLLEIEVDHGGKLVERLMQGRFDLALAPGLVWPRSFQALPLRKLERAWMASPVLDLPRRVLSVEDLSAWPIAAQYPDTVHAQLQSAWFQRNGYVMQHRLLANSAPVLGHLVMSGLGIGQLPLRYYQEALRSGRLVRLRTTPVLPDLTYYAVHRRSAPHALADALARIARQVCDFSVA